MDYREAIDVIKTRSTGRRYHEALKMAEDALDRQVPVAPHNELYCPICDFHVGDLNGDHFMYCPMCGQRLDFKRDFRSEFI